MTRTATRLLPWLGIALLSCGGDTPTTPPQTIALTLRAPEAQLVPSQSTQLVTTASVGGRDTSAAGATFTSSSAGVATVTAQGLVTAVAPGTASITARLGAASAVATLTVLQGGMLSAAGGTIRTTGGELELVAPAGAVDVNTPVTLSTSTTPWVDPTVARGAVYQVGRSDATFAKPVTLRARYVAANAPYGLPQAELGLRRASATDRWTDLRPSLVDSVAGTVTTSIMQGGTYSVGRLAPTTPCTGAAHRAFDFWLGSWNMTSGSQSAGENFITMEPGGCAIFENYVTPTNLSPGRSVSFYNPTTNRWYQTYIDAGNNMVLLASTSFSDQLIPMVSTPQGNGNVWTRTTWTRNVDGTVRQLIEATLNSGTSYSVQYDLLYRRK